MPTRPSKKKLDLNENAYRIMLEATGQAPKTLPPSMRVDPEKNPAAVARGRIGGIIGGKKRAIALTAEQRKEIAQRAAKKRWSPLILKPRPNESLPQLFGNKPAGHRVYNNEGW